MKLSLSRRWKSPESLQSDEAVAGSREGVAWLCCWCGVVTGLLSQTAVHFAENHRKWPDLGEVDCSLSKVGCTCSRAALFRACVGPLGRMDIDGLR